ncbi:MAG: hypothetical protein ACK4GW_08450 [Pseudorhodobacter sp.]
MAYLLGIALLGLMLAFSAAGYAASSRASNRLFMRQNGRTGSSA